MTKVATEGTLSPFAFGPGLPVYEADVQAVAENLNYVAGQSPTLYFSMITAGPTWGTGGSIATHNLYLPNSSGVATYYEGSVWIDPDEQEITVGATFTGLTGIEEAQVSWTLGSDAQNVNYAAGDNATELTHTFLTSATGTGWRLFKIQANHTVGTSTDVILFSIRMEAEPIAATDLPDPGDE